MQLALFLAASIFLNQGLYVEVKLSRCQSHLLPSLQSSALLASPMLEAELKIPLPEAVTDPQSIIPSEAEFIDEVEQVDTYFQHPVGDFASSDEALRLRQEGAKCWIAYKGPKQGALVKIREELAVGVSSAPGLMEILNRLGFVPAATVRKTRRLYRWRDILICLDEVEGLGRFIELEAAEAPHSGSSYLEMLSQAAQTLGLDARLAVSESYLELLLNKSGKTR